MTEASKKVMTSRIEGYMKEAEAMRDQIELLRSSTTTKLSITTTTPLPPSWAPVNIDPQDDPSSNDAKLTTSSNDKNRNQASVGDGGGWFWFASSPLLPHLQRLDNGIDILPSAILPIITSYCGIQPHALVT
jgi:hypothetical protein